jgi:MFS family permease
LVVACLGLLREPPRTGSTVTEKLTARQTYTALLTHRAVIAPLVAGVSMVAVADCAAMIWAAPMFARQFSLPPDVIGTTMAIVLATSGIAGALAGGLLCDFLQRMGGPRLTVTALGGVSLLSAGAGLFAIAPGAISASVLLTLFMTVGAVISVAATTLSTVVIPNELRGVCVAILFAVGTIFGMGLAPLLVSMLSAALGGPAMLGQALSWICAGTSAIGGLTLAFGRRYFPVREVCA